MARGGSRPPPQQLILLALLVCLHLVSASPSSSSSQPQPRPADGLTSARGDDGDGLDGARTCWYTVRIKTSCASPRRTSDAISLAFGDAYRDEVYAAQLGGSAAAFERCATDTFRIGGPCGYGVCYLYLRRAGRTGWTPEWVRVYEPTAVGAPSTFYYGEPLPDGVWYGFNRCPNHASSSSSSPFSVSAAAAAAQAM